VTWFDARSGEVQRAVAGSGDAVQTALVDAALKRVVAVTADTIVEITGDATPLQLAGHGARAIAIRPDGTLLVAPPTGGLVLIAADGTRTEKPYDGEAIRALAWHPEGFWIYGTKRALYRWTPDAEAATHLTSIPKDSEIDLVTCSDRAIAVGWDHDMVLTMEWPSRETLASVRYPDRKVLGVDFGPWPWVGICLDLGDGNMQTLTDEPALHRTDTHPGRTHHRWMVMTGGPSKPKAAAPKAAPAATPAPAPAPSSGGGMMRFVVIIVIVAIGAYLALRH
jgi:hypothetical protein